MNRVKLTASEGMLLTNGEVYGQVVYLGSGDSPDNWQEITRQQAMHKMAQEVLEHEKNLY